MKVWRMSKLPMTSMLATLIGAVLVSLTGTFIYSQTLQAASVDGGGFDWRGTVETIPTGSFVGTWVIGGRTFSANGTTEMNQDEGPLQVGSCAKVKYQVEGATNWALEIESQTGDDCGAQPTPTPSTTPDANATPAVTPDDQGGHGENHGNQPHGRIESLAGISARPNRGCSQLLRNRRRQHLPALPAFSARAGRARSGAVTPGMSTGAHDAVQYRRRSLAGISRWLAALLSIPKYVTA